MSLFSVYLIVSIKNKKIFSYVGYTNNLKNRIFKHNSSKGAKYTKGKFWKLAYFKNYKSKSRAMSEEYKLKKNYKLRKKIKLNYLKNENINLITL